MTSPLPDLVVYDSDGNETECVEMYISHRPLKSGDLVVTKKHRSGKGAETSERLVRVPKGGWFDILPIEFRREDNPLRVRGVCPADLRILERRVLFITARRAENKANDRDLMERSALRRVLAHLREQEDQTCSP
ncbi:hypothetical protein FK530_22895 [Tsukamurella conjunctivitidis]|uniref:Uncharacterized protein n=1 Tax=Tsukamurella conjunctivitidis TaxID=2592068 RepID=A0A5C5RSM9_9ACTN|nr:hypothetical protein [Tsukamurella conjunctivitidis]TWS25570.1 hypothetical protein FK530_22895 [Tsukamurella conjunctivitidis]